MAILKTTSAKTVIATVISMFNPSHNGWEDWAYEWIGEGLGIIGHSARIVGVVYERVVENNLIKIPCSAEQLKGIEWNGSRVPPIDGFTGIKGDTIKPNAQSRYWYYLNPNYIVFPDTLEGETIGIHAVTFALDEEGIPEVPDSSEHRQALAWFILRNMISRGYKHSEFTWKDANANWELWWIRAANKAKHLDRDRLEKFKQNWTQWLNDYRKGVRFGQSNNFGANPAEYIPFDETRQTTIIHVDNDDNDLQVGTTL
jgi:hypothetical protein